MLGVNWTDPGIPFRRYYLWQAVGIIDQWTYNNNVICFHLNNYLVIISDPSSGSSTDSGGQRAAVNRHGSLLEAAFTRCRYSFGYSEQSNAAHGTTQRKTTFLHSLGSVKLLIKSWLSPVVWTSLMPQQTGSCLLGSHHRTGSKLQVLQRIKKLPPHLVSPRFALEKSHRPTPSHANTAQPKTSPQPSPTIGIVEPNSAAFAGLGTKFSY